MFKKIFLIFVFLLLPVTIFAATYYTIYPTNADNTYAKPINSLDAVTYSEGMSNPPLPSDNIVIISADKSVYIQPVLNVTDSSDIGKEATALMYVVINGEGTMLNSYTTTIEDKTTFTNISSALDFSNYDGLQVDIYYGYMLSGSNEVSYNAYRLVVSTDNLTSAASKTDANGLVVTVYNPDKACNGTTLFNDSHDHQNPRIVEMDMNGNITWKYYLPSYLKQYTDPGFDTELLSNNDILFVAPLHGVYEIDRNGNVVWSHLDDKISHDADRLSNGDTIYAFGGDDVEGDENAKEVDANGNVVWSWSGQGYLDNYSTTNVGGWTHTNAVTRLDNGDTLINFRNFARTVEVDKNGNIVWQFDWDSLYPDAAAKSERGFDPHEPEYEADTNTILICLQFTTPYQAVEINKDTGEVVWKYHRDHLRTTRDCDRLPNGNTLITGVLDDGDEIDSSVIFEVTKEGEIVWELRIKDASIQGKPGWFYKAERICK